jgi:hypothetical protein
MIWGSSLEQPSLPSGGAFSTGSAKLALTVSAEQIAGMHDAFSNAKLKRELGWTPRYPTERRQ